MIPVCDVCAPSVANLHKLLDTIDMACVRCQSTTGVKGYKMESPEQRAQAIIDAENYEAIQLAKGIRLPVGKTRETL